MGKPYPLEVRKRVVAAVESGRLWCNQAAKQVFAKLKHLLRKAAARTGEAICLALGHILQAFTPDECANYFANSGRT